MTWEGWLASIAALLVGLAFGYLLGAMFGTAGKQAEASKAVDAADASATAAREAIDADTRKKLEQTDTAGAKELVDALNDDYAAAPGVVRGEADPAASPGAAPGKPARK